MRTRFREYRADDFSPSRHKGVKAFLDFSSRGFPPRDLSYKRSARRILARSKRKGKKRVRRDRYALSSREHAGTSPVPLIRVAALLRG